ncbi:hypothetical protein ACLOJK_010018 [Asimina triloba]
MESLSPKASPVNKSTDSRIFCGDVCGPIAATMNEAMFALAISKWRDAFVNLKETNSYKFLSAIGSLMKGMAAECEGFLLAVLTGLLYSISLSYLQIRMLDLVLKLLPEDSKEPRTARILLYKIFYDQTDQGMTHFLVAKKSRKGRKKKIHVKKIDTEVEKIVEEGATDSRANSSGHDIADPSGETLEKIAEEDANIQKADDLIHEIGNVTGELVGKMVEMDANAAPVGSVNDCAASSEDPIMDSNNIFDECLGKSNFHGKECSDAYHMMEQPGMPLLDTCNPGGTSVQVDNGKFNNAFNEPSDGTDYSSDDDQPASTNEVDFTVSKLVATFASNTMIQNLCWLLKFYKSNSRSTNHQIISMLQRICDDLELSPMLYQVKSYTSNVILHYWRNYSHTVYARLCLQLSLLTTFYDILSDQKSCTCKEYENIISFLTKLVRKLMKEMKSQPLLFVEILFWKTRKECHYINSQSLLYKLGNLKKETSKWQSISADEVEFGSSNGKGGFARRSIADALGEDEHDLATEHEIHRQRYKDNQQCCRLIAEALNPDGNISSVQVFGKLRQLGLKVGTKKKIYDAGKPFSVGDDGASIEGSKNGNDFLPSNELDRGPLPKKSLQSRKRVHAFSKEQELMLKDLFKNHKRCNQMIANALDADNAYTAAQVSRKLRQLGLRVPQKKRQFDDASITGQQGGRDSIVIDREEPSDEETLLSLKERYQKKRKNLSEENDVSGLADTGKVEPSAEETLLSLKERVKGKAGVKLIRMESTIGGPAKRKMETMLSQEDDADEVLSTILRKSAKRVHTPKVDKLEAPSGWETVKSDDSVAIVSENVIQSTSQVDAGAAVYLSNLDDGDVELGKSDGGKQPGPGAVQEGAEQMADMSHPSQQNYDDSEDSGDDAGGMVPKGIASRRKLKLVIDFDDDD